MPLDTTPDFQVTISEAMSTLRRAFDSRKTRSYAWRVSQLEALKKMVTENEAEIARALKADLGKSPFESSITETWVIVKEIDETLKHLAEWMKPESVSTPLVHQLGRSHIHREPLGVVLVIAPWNYPFQLGMAPLVCAIAAGNCVLLKPSEIAGATSAVVAKLIPKYMDRDCVRVIEGGVPETSAVLAQRFDHIFFTGSTAVGRIVAQAAAPNLTPTTLELGGKSPTIVARDANLDVAAKRIIWGKYLNCGQTCIAPDYVLVERGVEQPLLEALKATIHRFYGANPKDSPDLGRIVNERHFARLVAMLQDGEVFTGGEHDLSTKYIAPTILRNPKLDGKLMQEEIFGPLLPVIAVDDIDAAVRFINERPKPLALYVFTNSKSTAGIVLDRTSSGGACVNDTVSHFAIDSLPFGGVGESGMGAYHGRHGFETFSHRKGVLDRATAFDPPLRYAPYDDLKQSIVRKLY